MKKRILCLALVVMVAGCLPGFALSRESSNALNAFRRYEPDFLNSLKKLEEIQRKIQNQGLKPGTEEFKASLDDAGDLFEYVQKRYDLMDDLYKSASGDNPNDRAQLFDGFSRLDDLYRKTRGFFMEKFHTDENNGKPGKAKDSSAAPASEKEPASTQKTNPASVSSAKSSAKIESTGAMPAVPTVPAVPAKVPDIIYESDSNKTEAPATSEPEKKSKKVRLSGSLKLGLRNKNEVYPAQDKALPNNQFQGKLTLQYEMNAKNKFYLDEKYLQRTRNELVKENILTFSWMHLHSPKTSVSLKDTLHHVWYPADSVRAYRDNLAEAFWNKKEGRWERLYNLGLENRVYPEYSQADFSQLNYTGQNTYFIKNGTLYGESNYNWRSYRNSSVLDYSNLNYYAEFNRSYDGNKSEISVSDTFDSRKFGQESITLFRSDYWDNYFRFSYSLPVSKTWKWTFEDELQKRKYPSDYGRGYAQLKVKTTGHITIDKISRAKIGHTFTSNEENTEQNAHKNHEFMGMWEKNFSKTFNLKVEDNFHRRYSKIGDTMDFKENVVAAKATWKLPSKVELTWQNEYLSRFYVSLQYPDYRYFLSGLSASYAKPKKFNWSLGHAQRSISYRNLPKAATGWSTQSQPISEGKFSYYLRKDLKLRFTASREKTYYKYFDSISQDLLWDFAQPITVTEYFGGLEYNF